MKWNEFSFKNRLFALWIFFVSFVQSIVSLLLGGEKCLCCSKRTLRVPLCASCMPHIWQIGFKKVCSICGRPLVSEIGVCSQCKENSALRSVDKAFSLHSYQLWKKSLLFAWKLEDKRTLSPYFASLFYKKLKSLEEEYGANLSVVPVPPRVGKIREKGWDQIEELCYYLEKGWNVRILRLLERLSHVQQKKLDRVQRLEGIGSSYRVKNEKKIKKILPKTQSGEMMLPKAVVLADDVLTTGSTIESCARELKKLGVEHVFSITLFIVD